MISRAEICFKVVRRTMLVIQTLRDGQVGQSLVRDKTVEMMMEEGLQGPKKEDAREGNLLPLFDMKAPDHPDWHAENHHVCEEVCD